MARMKKIAFQVGLVALLALLGTATAHAAYGYPQADSSYHCRWERYNQTTGLLIGKGVSLVTFKNVTESDVGIPTQKGTLFTVYGNAGTLTRSYEIRVHVTDGGLTYFEPNAGSPQIKCALTTSNGANTVEWDCRGSNGVRQWCYQP